MNNNLFTVIKPRAFIHRGFDRIRQCLFGTILLFAFICVSTPSVNAQDRPWPYPANIETNDTVNAMIVARFGKGAKLLGGSFGQIKESVQRGWVGLIEIPASGKRSSVQALILSEIDYLTKYKIESISRKVALPECFNDDSCFIEVEANKLPVCCRRPKTDHLTT